MGPSLSGNFMVFLSLSLMRLCTRSASRSAASAMPACFAAAARRAREAIIAFLRFNKSSRQPLRRNCALRDDNGGPGRRELLRIGGLILIERMRKRHKDCGAPNHGEFRDGRGPGAGNDEMGLRDPSRQVEKERPDRHRRQGAG